MDQTSAETERPRLVRIAGRMLDDDVEAQDIVQPAWLRLPCQDQQIENLPGWLTTVTTRLCLDRLRARVPVPEEQVEVAEPAGDPADEVALADTVGLALRVVLDRLTPGERVATSMRPRHHSSSASAAPSGRGTTRTSARPAKNSTANRQHCASIHANRTSCRTLGG
ncbi:MAG: polymerase sigma-70 factor [Frankiales bacterium]|nr:polymerase sigma-70 factor [Frankiales bacterium]